MDVELHVERRLVVDDARQKRDVDPARGDVGGHQEPVLPLLHPRHHELARGLGEVAVEEPRVVAATLQVRGHRLGVGLGVAEDDRRPRVLALEHGDEQLLPRPLRVGDPVGDVLDPLHVHPVGREVDVDRVLHVAVDHLGDVVRERRREEQDLVELAEHVEDLDDVLVEPGREHLVGLVEHEGPHVREVERPARVVVEHAPRRPDDELDPRPEGVELLCEARAAVDRDRLETRVPGDLLELAVDLQRQLARGGQHQRLRLPQTVVEAGEQRRRERERLAAPGLRAHHEVAPLHRHLRAGGLHLEGFFVPRVADAHEHRVAEPELFERLCLGEVRGGDGGEA